MNSDWLNYEIPLQVVSNATFLFHRKCRFLGGSHPGKIEFFLGSPNGVNYISIESPSLGHSKTAIIGANSGLEGIQIMCQSGTSMTKTYMQGRFGVLFEYIHSIKTVEFLHSCYVNLCSFIARNTSSNDRGVKKKRLALVNAVEVKMVPFYCYFLVIGILRDNCMNH